MLSIKEVDEIKAQAYLGIPSILNGVCLIKPFTIKEIMQMGLSKYNGYLGILLMTETEIQSGIKEKTGQEVPIEEIQPLKYLLQSAAHDDMFLLELQTIFSTFVQEEVLLLPKINSVLIGSPEDRRLITEKNFRDFQDILRIQNRKDYVAAPPEDETPGERKMRLLREKVAEVKKKQAQKNNDGQSLAEMLEIAGTYGIDTENTTLYAFYGLLRRHQLKEKWQQDIQMICAGADSKKIKTKYWGESLDDE